MKIDTKELFGSKREYLKHAFEEYDGAKKHKPLAIIQVGDDPRSTKYVDFKIAELEYIGLSYYLERLPVIVTEDELLNTVLKYQNAPNVGGVLIQLPLPEHIDEDFILNLVSKGKDVDVLTTEASGYLMEGKSKILPCTVQSCIDVMEHHFDGGIKGKTITVIGRGKTIGKPLAVHLINEGATVISCNSNTPPEVLKQMTLNSDCVVGCVGKENLVTADMIREGCLFLNVGITFNSEGKIRGDLSLDAFDKAVYTPNINGIGFGTRLSVAENLMKLNGVIK